MRWSAVCLMAAYVVVAGCAEQSADTGKPAPVQTSGVQRLPPPPPPPALPDKPPPLPYPRGGGSWEDPQLVREREAQKKELVKAEAGVGVKGRRLDNPNLVQMIVVPARTLFAVQERLIFEVQIPQALQLYVASEGKPKTNREFMENIIVRNGIELPELPSGQRYVYDPQKEELMVEKPANQ